VPPLRALSPIPPRAPMAIPAVPPASETRYIPDEVLVELRTNARIDATRLGQDLRLQLLSSDAVPLLGSTFHRYRIPDGRQVRNVVIALSRNGAVARVQPHYLFTLSDDAPKADAAPQPATAAPAAAPAQNPMQYSATALHLPEAHRIAKGQAVLIAVIDSGVDVGHPELVGASVDSIDTLGETIVPDAHGTGMVGAIIARRDMTGVLALRAFGGQKTEGTTLTIIKALDKAVEAKARIINMSFAGPGDPALARALFSAREKGAALIAAMGNAGPKAPPAFPAADPNVLAVTAVDQGGKLFANANVGPYVGLATPGVDILLPSPNGAYQMATGTSVAAAHASGEAALLLEKAPDLPPLELRSLMVSTAVPVPSTRLDQTGGGLANPLAALEKLSAPKPGATR
jgi:subtilisin family serine protease